MRAKSIPTITHTTETRTASYGAFLCNYVQISLSQCKANSSPHNMRKCRKPTGTQSTIPQKQHLVGPHRVQTRPRAP